LPQFFSSRSLLSLHHCVLSFIAAASMSSLAAGLPRRRCSYLQSPVSVSSRPARHGSSHHLPHPSHCRCESCRPVAAPVHRCHHGLSSGLESIHQHQVSSRHCSRIVFRTPDQRFSLRSSSQSAGIGAAEVHHPADAFLPPSSIAAPWGRSNPVCCYLLVLCSHARRLPLLLESALLLLVMNFCCYEQ
jgi:hypothetical protein